MPFEKNQQVALQDGVIILAAGEHGLVDVVMEYGR